MCNKKVHQKHVTNSANECHDLELKQTIKWKKVPQGHGSYHPELNIGTARQQRQLQREVLNGTNLACLYVISPSSYYPAIKYASLPQRTAQAL